MSTASLRYPRSVLTVAGACFLALTGAILVLGAVPADSSVRHGLLAMATPAVVAVMRIVNRAGDWRVLLPGTLLLFVVFRRARERWWLWAGLMAVAPLLEGSFKYLVGRPRPEDASLGFPSGHSTAAAAFFGAVLYLSGPLPPARRRLVRALAATCMLLVGIARIVLRAHWPSDVLGGVTLGLGLATVTALLASLHAEPRS